MAKDGTINNEVVTPDFEAALNAMLHDVRPNKSDKQAAGKEESDAWKEIKDTFNCAAPAAKFFFAHILEREDETRDANLRTLYGLLQVANIGISADLVDKMGDGEAPKMPVKEASEPGLATVN